MNLFIICFDTESWESMAKNWTLLPKLSWLNPCVVKKIFLMTTKLSKPTRLFLGKLATLIDTYLRTGNFLKNIFTGHSESKQILETIDTSFKSPVIEVLEFGKRMCKALSYGLPRPIEFLKLVWGSQIIDVSFLLQIAILGWLNFFFWDI